MKAVVFEEFGEPSEVLSIREVAPKQPGPGQVSVRMLASPVNPSDLMTVRGLYGKLPELPATPGYEGVGIVEAAGPGLFGKFLKGKRVAFLNGDNGNWQERTIVNARQAVPLSDAVPLEQAAMFFVNPVTAYAMTREVLKVPPGAYLLQTGAGSSLGKMVIRLAQKYGFKTINVVRRSEGADALKKLGGDVVIATESEDLQARVRQITKGEGVRYALDCIGGATGSAVVKSLAPGAHMLVFGTLSAEPLSFSSRDLMTPMARLEGFWLARWMPSLPIWKKLHVVRTVGSLIKAGVLESEVGQSFALGDIKAAVTHAEAVARGGKVLLRIGS